MTTRKRARKKQDKMLFMGEFIYKAHLTIHLLL